MNSNRKALAIPSSMICQQELAGTSRNCYSQDMVRNKQVKSIGIINPGAMGISVAATMKNSGYAVLWAAQGRSEQSAARAAEHDLTDLGTMAALFDRSDALVSVCPPHTAEEVADQVIASGFEGIFVDANAIAAEKAQRIGRKMAAAGITFIDGGIIGEPAWEPGRTLPLFIGSRSGNGRSFLLCRPPGNEAPWPGNRAGLGFEDAIRGLYKRAFGIVSPCSGRGRVAGRTTGIGRAVGTLLA